MSAPAASTTSGKALIQQRLVGLAVLLGLAFLLSLVVSQGSRRARSEALQPVVIPLGATAPSEAPAPSLEEPELASSGSQGASRPERIAEPATPPAAAKPTLKPAPSKNAPSAPVAKPEVIVPKPVPAPAKPAPAKPATARPAAGPWFVVVGAYKDPLAAKAIANRAKLAGFKTEVVPVKSGNEQLQRVRAGPFASLAEAESARATLIVEGLTKSVVGGGR